MKKCIKCKINKKLDLFHNNKRQKDGKYYYCKECTLNRYDYKKVLVYISKNKKHREEVSKKYRDLNKEKIRMVKYKLYYSDNGLYMTFMGMKNRCNCPTAGGYKHYGGKGIKVEWKTYKEFKDDMYESYLEHFKKYGRKQTSLDRIDSDKNYCKENCRWATWREQCINRINSNK